MAEPLRALAVRVGQALLQRRWTITTAESCTGGWIAKTITDVPGSSGWFERGFVVYSNASKKEMLAVSEATLASHGAVSAAAAAEMARGALAHSRADIALAVSGVAGPDGGSPGKPVGGVWIAWASRDGTARNRYFSFEGDRDSVRRQAVEAALRGVLDGAG